MCVRRFDCFTNPVLLSYLCKNVTNQSKNDEDELVSFEDFADVQDGCE